MRRLWILSLVFLAAVIGAGAATFKCYSSDSEELGTIVDCPGHCATFKDAKNKVTFRGCGTTQDVCKDGIMRPGKTNCRCEKDFCNNLSGAGGTVPPPASPAPPATPTILTYQCHSSTGSQLGTNVNCKNYCTTQLNDGVVVSRGCGPVTEACQTVLPKKSVNCSCTGDLCNNLGVPPPPPPPPPAPPLECYLSGGFKLGPTTKCTQGRCSITFDASGHITSRGCSSAATVVCPTTLPGPKNSGGSSCYCEGALCNSLIGPERKCYSGNEGDCDFIDAVNQEFNMVNVDASVPHEDACDTSPGSRTDTAHDTCYTTVYSFQSKTCTIYGCSAGTQGNGANGWTFDGTVAGTRSGYHRYTQYATGNANATFVETTCTGSLCNTPAGKACASGGTGLTLSLVGLMAAVVAAYST